MFSYGCGVDYILDESVLDIVDDEYFDSGDIIFWVESVEVL